MTEAEQALLRAAASGAARMLEFGCGGSTTLLLAASTGTLVSVDSDAGWLARVGASPSAASALRVGRLQQWHADIGEVGQWGWPLEKPSAEDAWQYWGAPWLAMPQAEFVLVDGRFRIACALAAHGRLAPGGTLAVHDFWPRRAYQEALMPFFEVVGSVGTLALLWPRTLNGDALQEALTRHEADPR